MRNTDAFSWYLPILVPARRSSPSSRSTSGLISMCWRLAWGARPGWPRVFGSVRSSRRVDLRRGAGLTPELRSRAAVDQLPWIVWMKQATKEERWND
jgi:hypothetical protein